MTTITSIGSAGVQTGAQRQDSAKTANLVPDKAAADQAKAKAGVIEAQVTYSAGLQAVRTANKLMMGYLLNITA
ncbi:MAG: hypothetical protein KGJ78_14565 [Alphaproteobacteria bacterium]|nr:hypothetical protein [Alphaproteobacteria bacterium]